MDDGDIIELYFARDEQAIRETERKYGKLCRSIAYNILHNHEDTEECLNDTYNGVWNTIPPTRPGNFMSFVCAIARNLALKRLQYLMRGKRAQTVLVSLTDLEDILPDERIRSDVSCEALGSMISSFLRTQKVDNRNVFIRKYYFFDSIDEIASRYAFTQSKVKNMLYHTRIKLRDYLIQEGVEI